MSKKFTCVDLFSGAGGLSRGFYDAGYDVVLGVDFDEAALKTFRENHGNAEAMKLDLFNHDNINVIVDFLRERDIKLDVLVGGPPCQGFSIAGPRDMNDKRNSLYLAMVELADRIKPQAVVLENVPGMLQTNGGIGARRIVEDFKKIGENKAALDTFYEAEHLAHETPMEFCIRNGWEKYVYEMLVVDFLILNRDRHGANIEVLRNSEEKTLRLAPIFDHGLSLLFSCHTEEAVEKFDIMQDRPVQCFVGSIYAQQNLQLIPREKMPQRHPLQEKHKAILLEGLDGIIPRYLQEKIWNMIWKRWLYYEDFCNQK